MGVGSQSGPSRTIVQKNRYGTNNSYDQRVRNYYLFVDVVQNYALNQQSGTYPFVELTKNSVVPVAGERSATSIVALPESGLVENLLADDNIAKVVGKPGVGKTTLALMVAGGELFTTAYFADFSRITLPLNLSDRELVLRRLDDLDAAERLLIVDNAHMDPGAEDSIVGHWRRSGRKGALLIVARETGKQGPTGVATVNLGVTPETLEVVYEFVRRETRSELPEPPGDAYAQWALEFPDLVSFALAVRNQLGLLTSGKWSLSLKHAVDYVRTLYVVGPPEGSRSGIELTGLRLLVASGVWECAVSASTLPPGSFGRFQAEGLIVAEGESLKLPHPTTAVLLAQALEMADPRPQFDVLCEREPFVGFRIAIAMVRNGFDSDADGVLARLTAGRVLRAELVADLELDKLMKIISLLVKRRLVDADAVDAQLGDARAAMLFKFGRVEPVKLLKMKSDFNELPVTGALLREYIGGEAFRTEIIYWAHDADLLKVIECGPLLGKLGQRGLARTLIEVVENHRAADLRATLAEGVPSVLAILSTASPSEGKARLGELIQAAVEENLDSILRSLLERGLDDFSAYDKILLERWPTLIPPFRRAAANEQLAGSLDSCLSNSGLGSLARMTTATHMRVGLPYPSAFVDRIRSATLSALSKESLTEKLRTLSHADLAVLFGLRDMDVSFDGPIRACCGVLKEHARDLGMRHLEMGLGPFVHVGDMLDSYCEDAAGLWRDLALDPALTDHFTRALAGAADSICAQFSLWLEKHTERLPEALSSLLAERRMAPPLRATKPNQFLLSSICLRVDRLYSQANYDEAVVDRNLALFEPTTPAVTGRLLAIAATSGGDLQAPLDALLRLFNTDKFFAMVGAVRMVESRPDGENVMWQVLLREAPFERALLMASAGRALAVARGLAIAASPDDVTGRDAFPSIAMQLVDDWYSRAARPELVRHLRGQLYAYARGPKSISPPLYPYRVISLAHVLGLLGGMTADLEGLVSDALSRELVDNVAPLHLRQFRQWAAYSDLAESVLARSDAVRSSAR